MRFFFRLHSLCNSLLSSRHLSSWNICAKLKGKNIAVLAHKVTTMSDGANFTFSIVSITNLTRETKASVKFISSFRNYHTIETDCADNKMAQCRFFVTTGYKMSQLMTNSAWLNVINVIECFQEKPRTVSEWTGLPGEESVKRFERSNGLDTALYKTIPFTF